MTNSIAIIGAGMAGLSAARSLRDSGREITVFEKSRGLGGRMATRRVGDVQFDHGAQYFTARGDVFRTLTDVWIAGGAAAQWLPSRFVGTPGMSSPARHLASGLTIVRGTEIKALTRAGGQWRLHGGEPGDAEAVGCFDALVLAIPSPQAGALLKTAGMARADLDAPRYAPCLTAMMAFRDSVYLAGDGVKPDHPAISWIARDSAKPGRARPGERIVVHATSGWSRENLERDKDEIAAGLLAEFRDLTGIDSAPHVLLGHRWRYALVEKPLGSPCLWDADIGLGACGDWCIGPRVEAAFDSGAALAQRILSSEGNRHAG